MELRFPIWKPTFDNGGPLRVRIQESYSNLVDRMRFGKLLLKMASHVIPSLLSRGENYIILALTSLLSN